MDPALLSSVRRALEGRELECSFRGQAEQDPFPLTSSLSQHLGWKRERQRVCLVVKVPHLATIIEAAEVVMATMEEEIVEVELTMTLEIISSNLITVDEEWKLW